MSGLRAGVIVFIGVGVSNLCAYGFHLVSARTLGPSSYSDVAALTALVAIVSLPLGGVQVFVGRHVAREDATGHRLNDGSYVSGFCAAMAALGVGVAVVLALAAPLIKSVLGIASLSAVVLAVASVAPSFVAPALVGVAQGVQRFVLLAITLATPAAVRVALAAVGLHAGLGVAGTQAATLVASLFAVALPLTVLWKDLRPFAGWRPRLARGDALSLLPVVAGMLAITCLTTDDLVAAKAIFSSHEAGIYGAASLIGRVILYLPLAIVTVLLPQVAAGASAGRETGHLLRTALIATGGFCLAFTALYVAVPHLIVRIAFGSKYEGGSSLLWMFGVSMTLYSLLNVMLIYRLGRGETRISWLLLVGVGLQALLFGALHSSAHELLAASIATAAILLATTALLPTLGTSRLRLVQARETHVS
jgi:O-antigen/teichoic acid export membrane protein